MATAPKAPAQGGVDSCVKKKLVGSFVGEHPCSLQRRHAEPFTSQVSADSDADCHSAASTAIATNEGSWSDAGHRSGIAEEPVAKDLGCLLGGGVQLTVKNTFIDIEDESPLVRRVSTMPATPLRLPFALEEGDEDAEEDDSHMEATCGLRYAASTPTPWAESQAQEELLRFWTPESSQIDQVAAQGEQQPAAPSSAPQPAPLAAGTAPAREQILREPPSEISIIAHDKNLAVSQVGRARRVRWNVDAKKLRGSDKHVVSPPMDVVFQTGVAPVTFKLMLHPKGGFSFRKSNGIGYIQLKCCADLPEAQPLINLIFSVGSGGKAQKPRGPFVHGFGSSSVFNMPKDEAEWDFGASVDPSAFSFTVAVDIDQPN